MQVTIPPWLDVKPSDFAQAAGRGLEAGLHASSIQQEGNIEAARLLNERALASQRAQTSNAEIAMEGQRLAAAQQQAQENAQIRDKQIQNEFLLSQQRNNVLDAYHQATIGLRKNALQATAQNNALKFGDQQALSQAVQAEIGQGVSPDKAFANNITKFPRLWGSGIETTLTRSGSAQPKSTVDWKDKVDYSDALREKRDAEKAMATDVTADRDELQKRIKDAQATIDRISSKGTSTGPGDQTGSAGGSMPKAGDIVAGYRFKGGDPSKQDSWEQVENAERVSAQ